VESDGHDTPSEKDLESLVANGDGGLSITRMMVKIKRTRRMSHWYQATFVLFPLLIMDELNERK
jgi:hypothetical protein